MEFVYMEHPRLEKGAKFPESAVPHWEGYGWVRTDPPAKPVRPATPPAHPVKSTPVDATTADDKKPSAAKTPKAPSGRKED